jgi:hypothetical protein
MHLPFVELCLGEFEQLNAAAQGVKFPQSAHAAGFQAARRGAIPVEGSAQRPEALWMQDARSLNWWNTVRV